MRNGSIGKPRQRTMSFSKAECTLALFCSAPPIVARAPLEPFEDVRDEFVVHSIDQIEVNPGVSERATESDHQCKLLRSELVAILDESSRQIVSSLVAKRCVRHRLLGKPLEHIDTYGTVLRRHHANIVLAWKCYCLTDSDCTSR